MSSLRLWLVAIVAALAACSPRPAVESAQSADSLTVEIASEAGPAATDFKSIAARVVRQSAGISRDELVQIAGSPEDLPLLEDMAIEVRKLGAHPIVTVSSERFSRRSYDEVPAELDSQSPKGALAMVGILDVFIATESGEGRTLQGVPPERQAARSKAAQPIFTAARKHGIRFVSLGNGLYPTAERAEQLGLSRDELSSTMFGGIDTDYEALQATGERLRAALARGNALRITGPSGTDLRVSIAGRPVEVSDGVISADDRKRGGSALSAWLPAGEVYLVAVPGSAEGVIVADRYFHEGRTIEGLRLEVKGGKITRLSARSGLEGLQARYDAAGPGKDAVGVIDFGINPSIRMPEGKAVNVWSRAGAVTISMGGDLWAGGTNDVDFGIAPEIAAATVTLDGAELVKEGKLVAAPTVAAR